MTNGLVVMTPSSIAYSGTSASINADGSVDFSAVTSLRLNGVFTGDYDNYMIAIRHLGSATTGLAFQLCSGGVNATGSDYTAQILQAESTTLIATRFSDVRGRVGNISSTQRGGDSVYVFGPYLAQPTATRNVSIYSKDSGSILDFACTHSLSNSYDGINFFSYSADNFTGLLTVFGFNQ